MNEKQAQIFNQAPGAFLDIPSGQDAPKGYRWVTYLRDGECVDMCAKIDWINALRDFTPNASI